MTKRIQRIYVDSTAIGGKFNTRIAEQTKPFWDAFERGEVIIIVSDVLEEELQKAPQRARDFYADLPESQVERVVSTDESNTLATQYIAEGVVDKASLNDCKHVALATIARADVIVSWNLTHMVNKGRIDGYNGVNLLRGYSQIDIRTPEEVFHG
jgi:predicted nucleic acid-binding protein